MNSQLGNFFYYNSVASSNFGLASKFGALPNILL